MNWSLTNIKQLDQFGVSAHIENDGDASRETYQLFYTSNARGGLAIDGLSDSLQLFPQGEIDKAKDLTIVTLKDGKRRAYYIDQYEIYTALISDDGLTLSNISSTGITNTNENKKVAWGVPDAVVLPDDSIRLYWVDDDTGFDTRADEFIVSATSSNSQGTNFKMDEGKRVEGGYVDFEVLKAKDNDWVAIMSSSPETVPAKSQGIYVGTSNDGLTWTINETNLAPTDKSYMDPTGVLFSTSDNKWQLVMSESELILGDKDYSLVSAELTYTILSELKSSDLESGSSYTLQTIKDYDGNIHGYLGEPPTVVKSAYKYQGKLDVNNDKITEAIFTNKESGRWVTASIDPITGAFDYASHGRGGTTRIVGIYEDPLVQAGIVEKDSVFDGSRTFINDLKIDNLILKTVGDYDSDGFQEVYWSKVDNTAYLRAVMHADGNIQYANYQNLDQMTDYLTSHGFADTVALIA
mgnify:CR=1 FL=1